MVFKMLSPSIRFLVIKNSTYEFFINIDLANITDISKTYSEIKTEMCSDDVVILVVGVVDIPPSLVNNDRISDDVVLLNQLDHTELSKLLDFMEYPYNLKYRKVVDIMAELKKVNMVSLKQVLTNYTEKDIDNSDTEVIIEPSTITLSDIVMRDYHIGSRGWCFYKHEA